MNQAIDLAGDVTEADPRLSARDAIVRMNKAPLGLCRTIMSSMQTERIHPGVGEH